MNYLTTRNNAISSFFNDVFFRDFFGDDFFAPLPILKKIDYPVDIYETDDGLFIDIAAIGLDKDDIKVNVKDDVISVSYQKDEEVASDKEIKRYAYRGITRKSFNLAWRISDTQFDIANTKATFDKGLLKVFIPIAPEKKPKEIEIKVE